MVLSSNGSTSVDISYAKSSNGSLSVDVSSSESSTLQALSSLILISESWLPSMAREMPHFLNDRTMASLLLETSSQA